MQAIAVCRFDTDRLLVSHWAPVLDDRSTRPAILAEVLLLLSPAVTEFLPAPLCLANGPDAVEEWVSNRRGESEVCCVRAKAGGDFIGLLILAPWLEEGGSLTLRLGYLLNQAAWGRGYATELIRGLVTWCQTTGVRAQILAGVERNNGASGAVLIKAGFHKLPEPAGSGSETYQLDI